MNNMKYIFILFCAIALALTVYNYRKTIEDKKKTKL